MTTLRQHQYEISRMDGTLPLLFGTEDTGYLTIDRPVHAGGDARADDADRFDEDGIMFGRETRGAKTISFTIGVLTDKASVGTNTPHETNLDYLDALESRWVDPTFRSEPGRMAMLRACEVTGRTYRAYGRPRRYEEAAGRLTRSGYTPVVCDFQLVDNAWYSDEEQSQIVTLRPTPQGGFKAPLVAPFRSIAEQSSTASVAAIGGNRSTWPTVEFHGPCVDPQVRIGDDYTVGIRGALAYDEVIVFDPAPWSRSVYRVSDGAPMAGRLSAATPAMRRARVQPGVHDVEYRGTDVSGTSYVRVRWRTARSRP